ncbi:MFS-type efflux pump MSMEG_3705-like [Amphibalanus amphitrite]|uniref:MFS-type efflux pump MSMEG_3705-like n=1 Tax=Amphibalanus amphitrite TaxID=1232801 RepID=UPI001C8FFF87|nr:MFS-type efflux pump MSMEG_3705-like [Amphibalanus amphitrite]
MTQRRASRLSEHFPTGCELAVPTSLPKPAPSGGIRALLLRSSGYSLYVLALLAFTNLLNQLDRYMLAVVARSSAQEIHFGDQGCLLNDTVPSTLEETDCSNCTDRTTCISLVDAGNSAGCKWDYTGTGTEYDLLAGPIFVLVFTIAGVPLGIAADLYNRKLLLCGCLFVWSTCVVLTGLAEQYWQLAALRFGVGFGEAGCTPFATSLLADYFSPELRGTALGVYNWGIYFGYSLSYAVGDFITEADIMGMGWRWAYFLSGSPGILLSFLMLFTLREPPLTDLPPPSDSSTSQDSLFGRLPHLLRMFFRPSILLLSLAGAIRNAAGYVWSYSAETYFESTGQTPAQIGTYMSWIPMVSGSVGVLVGGFVSDRVVSRVGPHGRVWVIVASQLLAAPFVFCVLFLEPPWAYICLIPTYIIGEVWVPITLVVLVELVPAEVRTSAVALYFFITTNIGGNMPLLLNPVKQAFKNAGYTEVEALRNTLYLFFPGEYILGAIVYVLALLALRRDLRKAQTEQTPSKRSSLDGKGETNLAFDSAE